MFICNPGFHAIFIQQSSGRKRKILKKSKKYSRKNVYVRIMCNFLCVCVDYICILLGVVVYVIVSMCLCMMIHAPHGRFEVVS